jgi:Cdc6-like AAA superfamily ATPase
MSPRFNPYKPHGMVTPGMFVGRFEEVFKITQAFVQTMNDNPHHFLIHGERGIGKSSLLLYADALAKGDIKSPEGEMYNFISVKTDLEEGDTQEDLVRKIAQALKKAMTDRTLLKDILKTSWEFIRRIEAYGVKIRDSKEEPPRGLIDEVVQLLTATSRDLGNQIEGIVVFIDEADRGASTVGLGNFVKLLTERLTHADCHNVCIGVAGLPEVLSMMKESHSSSLRIFNVMELEPLSVQEREAVIQKGLDAAFARTKERTTITQEASAYLAELSEGYPHFLQQYSYCAFEAHQGEVIKHADVHKGAYDTENGAIAQLGNHYFHNLYFKQIGSDDYRKVLHAMASDGDNYVSKKQLADRTRLKPATLTNAIGALKKKNIIRAKTGTQGLYKLPSRSFAAWMRAFTADLSHPTI